MNVSCMKCGLDGARYICDCRWQCNVPTAAARAEWKSSTYWNWQIGLYVVSLSFLNTTVHHWHLLTLPMHLNADHTSHNRSSHASGRSCRNRRPGGRGGGGRRETKRRIKRLLQYVSAVVCSAWMRRGRPPRYISLEDEPPLAFTVMRASQSRQPR
ncbi:hypothetical protein BGY98DRAFT_517495 [Russula aff. rugulosa BPL654]|jgi:hypothetical protein|nr:hypothetical protein BGY98DRAFT_517495 [Russula aff. rugulosa BPL654]